MHIHTVEEVSMKADETLVAKHMLCCEVFNRLKVEIRVFLVMCIQNVMSPHLNFCHSAFGVFLYNISDKNRLDVMQCTAG